MKNKKVAILALSMALVGALGLTACGGSKGNDAETQVFESEAAWAQAWADTLSQTNARILFTGVGESSEGEFFMKEEGVGDLRIADEQMHCAMSGYYSCNYEEEGEIVQKDETPFTSDSYVYSEDGIAKEVYKENGEIVNITTIGEFEFNVEHAFLYGLSSFPLEGVMEMYSMFTVEDGYYTFFAEEAGMSMEIKLQFADGKLSYAEMHQNGIDEWNGWTVVTDMTIEITYGGVTIGDVDVEEGEGSEIGDEKGSEIE